MFFVLSQINFLKWRPFEFLAFYAVALAVWWLWIAYARKRALRKFEGFEDLKSEELTSHEVAVLANGLPRLTQLAVVELLECDAVDYRKGVGGNCLIYKKMPTGTVSRPAQSLLDAIEYIGTSGLPIKASVAIIKSFIEPIQVTLAKRGLKPTPKEWWVMYWKLATPLLALIFIGSIRFFNGVSLGRPTGYLLLLLLISFGSFFLLKSFLPKLTERGKTALDTLKANVKNQASAENVTTSLPSTFAALAVLGPTALVGFETLKDIHEPLSSDLTTLASSNFLSGGNGGGSGFSGCSSGCGGGGGGGCGGCGG